MNLASEYSVCAGALIALLESKLFVGGDAEAGVFVDRSFDELDSFGFDS